MPTRFQRTCPLGISDDTRQPAINAANRHPTPSKIHVSRVKFSEINAVQRPGVGHYLLPTFLLFTGNIAGGRTHYDLIITLYILQRIVC